MPRFFFNLKDGGTSTDPHGIDLADISAAGREALATAGALIGDMAQGQTPGDHWDMDVTDETGAVVYRVSFKCERIR